MIALKPRKAVCFDFDGVIHKYSEGWKDGSIYDEPNYDVISCMQTLMKNNIPCFICSTRNANQIYDWWKENVQPTFNIEAKLILPTSKFWNSTDCVGITNIKLAAQLYIDDRAFVYVNQSYKELMNGFIIDKTQSTLF